MDIGSQIDQEIANNPAPKQQQAIPFSPQAASDPIAQSIDQEMDAEKYGTLGQQALTVTEGVAKGALGPIATAAERALSEAGVPGLTPEAQIKREHTNPWEHGGAETLGLVGSSLLGVGQAKALSAIGEAAVPIASAIGLAGGPGAGILGKIGSSAVKGAVENAFYQIGDEISKKIQGRPSDMVETALPNVGLAAMIGGAFGAAGGGVSALWRAKAGTQVGATLNAIGNRVGGIEGIVPDAMEEAIQESGMDVAPEVRAGLSDDPAVRQHMSTLMQSDTAPSRELQGKMTEFYNDAGKTITESLGKTPESIPKQFDAYSAGKTIGDTLASEVAEKVDPLSNKFQKVSEQFKNIPLEPSLSVKAPELGGRIVDAEGKVAELTKRVSEGAFKTPEESLVASESLLQAEKHLSALREASQTPGTTDSLLDKVNKLAKDQGWVTSPSSDIMKLVNQVNKELPLQENLKNLTDYITQVGNASTKDPLNGPLRRAGGMIKSILREGESDVIAQHLGQTEGEEAVAAFRQLQKEWAGVSSLKEALDDRLHLRGSTSGYAEQIRTMASEEGEKVLNRLSGKNDANLLDVLGEHFPKTAEAVRDAHLDRILSYANRNGTMNAGDILGALNNGKQVSPQLRSFLLGNSEAKVDAISNLINKLKDPNHNWSNTARVATRLNEYVPGTVTGLISLLTGHSPTASFLVGGLTKYLSRDAPDAARLALLKWLGSSQPVEAGAFKSMFDFIHHTIQGQDLISKGTKALVSGATKVIPAHLMPSEQQLKKLDDQVKKATPQSLMDTDTGNGLGYYMEGHGMAATATVGNAVQTLKQLRPQTKKQGPLDPEIKPTPVQEAKYMRQLTIAEQPLMLLHYASLGQLTTQDVNLGRQLYPSFVNQVSQNLTHHLIDHVSDGNELSSQAKISLSKLVGTPLVSSLTPPRILGIQSVFQGANQATPPMPMPKPSLKGIRDMKASGRMSLQRNDEGN